MYIDWRSSVVGRMDDVGAGREYRLLFKASWTGWG